MTEFTLQLQNFDETMQAIHNKYPRLTPDQLNRAALIVCTIKQYADPPNYKVQFRVGRTDLSVVGKEPGSSVGGSDLRAAGFFL